MNSRKGKIIKIGIAAFLYVALSVMLLTSTIPAMLREADSFVNAMAYTAVACWALLSTVAVDHLVVLFKKKKEQK